MEGKFVVQTVELKTRHHSDTDSMDIKAKCIKIRIIIVSRIISK